MRFCARDIIRDMTRQDTSSALNAILGLVGSRGLSGVRAPGNSLVEALERLGAFSEDLSPADRQALAANLRRQGLVEITRSKDGYLLQPSVKGIHRLQRAQIANLSIRPQQNWDGVWRMISYDIPARHSKERRLFVAELHRLGFTPIKDSAWFHPYPCFDVISELIAFCGISQFVMVAEIVRLDEGSLRKLRASYPELS